MKNLTTAEGGALVWTKSFGMTDEEMYKEYMLLSLHGQSRDAFSKVQIGCWEYDVIYPGYKCNMTDVLAGIGLGQIKRYDEMLSKRFEIVKIYEQMLDKSKIEILSHRGDMYRSSAHLMLCNIRGANQKKRNEIINSLAKYGIATNVHYKPLPLLTAYKNMGFKIEDYPNAYNKFCNQITLPLYSKLEVEDVIVISEKLNSLL